MSDTAQRGGYRPCTVPRSLTEDSNRMNAGDTARLINRMAAGDQTALSALYELTVAMVYRLVIDVLSSEEEAHSVVCDIYVAVWRRASSLQKQRHVGIGWLLEIAGRQASERARALAAEDKRPQSAARGTRTSPASN
jgi:DNA-directed RNA polymerase specialized sigma24 family protein